MTTRSLLQALLIGVAAVSLVLCCIRVFAAKGQRLICRPGRGVTIEGKVSRGGRDLYLVEVRAGQTLRVAVKSPENNAVIKIRYLGGSGGFLPGAGEGADALSWQGALPRGGTCQIVIRSARGNAEYVLLVELTNEAG
ncbi:MAG: hypothetical protein AB9872_10065 [Solidesulfovibrio sp.]